MRAFVATFLSDASAERLETAVADCLEAHLSGRRDARPVPRRNYHVTLKFLGPVDEDELRRAAEAVAALGGHAVPARITGFAGLPRSARARLAAAVVDREAHLTAWWTALQQSLGAEARGFRPHVTVVRFGRPRALVPLPLPEPLEVALEAPRLYRSDQGPEGVVYRPVELG